MRATDINVMLDLHDTKLTKGLRANFRLNLLPINSTKQGRMQNLPGGGGATFFAFGRVACREAIWCVLEYIYI